MTRSKLEAMHYRISSSVVLSPNVNVLCDVAVSKHFTINLTQMFNKGTDAEFCTSPAILQNTCYLPYLI